MSGDLGRQYLFPSWQYTSFARIKSSLSAKPEPGLEPFDIALEGLGRAHAAQPGGLLTPEPAVAPGAQPVTVIVHAPAQFPADIDIDPGRLEKGLERPGAVPARQIPHPAFDLVGLGRNP